MVVKASRTKSACEASWVKGKMMSTRSVSPSPLEECMSQDQHTRFQLTFNGISLELHGEKEFVEEMYREVMADLEEARARNARGEMPSTAPVSAKPLN